jgi:hypothetical protein
MLDDGRMRIQSRIRTCDFRISDPGANPWALIRMRIRNTGDWILHLKGYKMKSVLFLSALKVLKKFFLNKKMSPDCPFKVAEFPVIP